MKSFRQNIIAVLHFTLLDLSIKKQVMTIFKCHNHICSNLELRDFCVQYREAADLEMLKSSCNSSTTEIMLVGLQL